MSNNFPRYVQHLVFECERNHSILYPSHVEIPKKCPTCSAEDQLAQKMREMRRRRGVKK